MYEKAVNLICEFEGFRSKAYKCPAGIWTVGYGKTGKDVTSSTTITEPEAREFVRKQAVEIANQITSLVKVPLNNNQICALISFVYNLGIGNFKSSTLLKKLNQQDYVEVGNQFLRWDKCNGKPLAGLTKRRQAEKKLFDS